MSSAWSHRFQPWLLVLIVSACAHPPRPGPVSPDPPPPPAPRALTDDERTRLADLLDPVEPEPPPAVEPPSAWSQAPPARPRAPVRFSERDRRDVVRVLCEASEAVAGKRGFRCDCPSYTEMTFTVAEGLGLELGPFFPGHFSGPGRDEAVVVMSGCESGAGSSQTYAEAALVRRTPAGWERVYHQHDALGDCASILSPGGRSRLVCHRTGGHQGHYPVAFNLVGFDEVGVETRPILDPILSFTTHEGGPCCAPDPVFKLDVTRHALLGKAAYEAGDERALTFEVSVRSHVVCVDHPDACARLGLAPVTLSLRYTFDGTTFRRAPESAATEEMLRSRDVE